MSKVGPRILIALAFLASALQLPAQPVAAPALRKAAIFVDNHAGKNLDDKSAVLEDLIASRVAGQGFTVISRQISLNALAPGQKLDQLLNENSSVLRLAQSLGVDYLLAASIATYDVEKKTYDGNGVKTINQLFTMRLSYKIAEAGQGALVAGDTISVNKTVRQTEGLQIEISDVVNQLLDEAAGRIADGLASRAGGLAAPTAKPGLVKLSIKCSMTDLTQQPLTLPAVGVTADNKLVVATNQPVQALDVTVELNGLVLGSAPGTFQAPAGLNKLKLTREGFKPWERTINIYDGQTLMVALQMSEAGYNRWKDNTAFLQDLENDRKLTDAEVKVLEGKAKELGNSYSRMDTKENVKIYKSLY